MAYTSNSPRGESRLLIADLVSPNRHVSAFGLFHFCIGIAKVTPRNERYRLSPIPFLPRELMRNRPRTVQCLLSFSQELLFGLLYLP